MKVELDPQRDRDSIRKMEEWDADPFKDPGIGPKGARLIPKNC